jgi:ferredoxin, 2Fe-2S
VARITYVEANGTRHVVEVETGLSVKEGAVRNGIPGILAECGGACACGTCRVYVDRAWREKTGAPSEIEDATMEALDDVTPGRRLSCQINITAELDGLIVRMPERQF